MANPQSLDGLIENLGADLKPVDPLWPPFWRAGAWIAILALVASVMSSFANMAGIAHRLMGASDMWLAVMGSTLTAVFGAVAVFQISVPGRSSWWAALPVPSLVLWIGASGLGCLRTWFIPDMHEAAAGEAGHCFGFIVAVSIPLSILTALMIRRAYPLRPGLTAAVAGLTVAAGAATLLNFFHPYDASATDLSVHFAAVAVVVGSNQALASRFWAPLRRARPSRAARQ